MSKGFEEWLKQANYDLETAEFMFKGQNKGNFGMDKKNVIDVISRFRSALEAVAMTPEEWEKEDSFISLYARNGEVVY